MCRIFLLILIFINTSLIAQDTQKFEADLNALHDILKKTPSYKDQIKGSKAKAYNLLIDSIRKAEFDRSDNFACFENLAQLFLPIRDNHLGFNQLHDPTHFMSRATIEAFMKTYEFEKYPSLSIDTDSLVRILSLKEMDEIEGLYFYEQFYTVGLFRSGDHHYTGIIVDSAIPLWKKGQVAMKLYEFAPGKFKAIYGHPLYKSYLLYNNESFRNRSLINSHFYNSFGKKVYTKDTTFIDYSNIQVSAEPFIYKSIDPQISYIKLGDFMANDADRMISDKFYNEIKDLKFAPNLIIDLRNNTGGAEKISKKFLKLFENYSRHGKVYVLINHGTMSQGEIFTLQMKKLKNVHTFGQTTMGTIAYGSNRGTLVQLPSRQFEVYITDMKDNAHYLAYESIGVVPDYPFNNDSNWISQLRKIIELERIKK